MCKAGQTQPQTVYLVKLDSDGQLTWASPATIEQVSENFPPIAHAVAYHDSAIFVTGTTTENAFVWKVEDAGDAGNTAWLRAIDRVAGSTFVGGRGMTVDSSGNVWVTGSFRGTVDFDPSTGTFNLTSAISGKGKNRAPSWDIFVWGLDNDGNFLRAIGIGGSGDDSGNAIASDGQHVYIAGHFTGQVDFNPGTDKFVLGENDATHRAFVLKLDTAGNFVWAAALGTGGAGRSALRDQFFAATSNAIALDGNGNVITAGHFHGTQDFDPTDGQALLTAELHEALFLIKLGQPAMAGTTSLTTASTSSHDSYDSHHSPTSLTALDDDDAAMWTAAVAAPSALPPAYSAPPQTPLLPPKAAAAGRLESLPYDRPAPEWLPEAALPALSARAAETARDLLFAGDDPLGLELSPASV